MAVDWDIHEGPGLDLGAGLLDQLDLAGQGRLPGVARPVHRGSPNRLGVHIKTEGAQVAVAEGFQIDDGGIERTLARRSDAVVGKPFIPDAGEMGGEFLRANDLCKPDPLDAGHTATRPQGLDVGPPVVALHPGRRGKQGGAPAQDQRIGAQALTDLEGDLIAAQGELPGGILLDALLDLKAGEQARQ